jgi:hypothetical protein
VPGVLALVVGAVAGFTGVAGREPAYTMAGIMGSALLGLLFVAGVVAAAVLGLLALALRRLWVAVAFVLLGGYLLGYLGGAAVADAQGLGNYRPPTNVFPSSQPLFAHGTATMRLDAVGGFAPRAGDADCRKGDLMVVQSVEAWDAGRLGDAMLRADVHVTEWGVAGLSVWAWSSSMPGSPPKWFGQGRTVTVGSSGGRVTFDGMALDTSEAAAPGTWPAELSGEISWTCGAWSSTQPTSGL